MASDCFCGVSSGQPALMSRHPNPSPLACYRCLFCEKPRRLFLFLRLSPTAKPTRALNLHPKFLNFWTRILLCIIFLKHISVDGILPTTINCLSFGDGALQPNCCLEMSSSSASSLSPHSCHRRYGLGNKERLSFPNSCLRGRVWPVHGVSTRGKCHGVRGGSAPSRANPGEDSGDSKEMLFIPHLLDLCVPTESSLHRSGDRRTRAPKN